MNQVRKISFRSPNHRAVGFFMWLALAAAALTIISAVLFKWVLAAIGFILLVVAKKLGQHFSRMGLNQYEKYGLSCGKCGQRVNVEEALQLTAPDERVARCQYCGEPFGTFSN